MKVEGKIVIITGSAQGLGKAFASHLLNEGAKVCISDLNAEIGKETVSEFGERFGRESVHFIQCDVTKHEDLKNLYDGCEEHFGSKVDIFCNNAGISNTLNWQKCMEVNIMAVMSGTYLALEKMSRENGGKGGVIINIASLAGINKSEMKSIIGLPYFVSKHAVVALTRLLGQTSIFRETGVSVKCLCPAYADTAILPPERREKLKASFGLMTPDFVALAFMNLVRDCSSGSALAVMKDNPPFLIPDYSNPIIYGTVATVNILNKITGDRVHQPWEQILFYVVVLLLIHFLLGIFLF